MDNNNTIQVYDNMASLRDDVMLNDKYFKNNDINVFPIERWFEGCNCVGYIKHDDSFVFTQGMGMGNWNYDKRVFFCISRSGLTNLLKYGSFHPIIKKTWWKKLLKI